MSKSTLDALEKMLLKHITPLEQKVTSVMKQLKNLEDKFDKLEAFNAANIDIARKNVSTTPQIPATMNSGACRPIASPLQTTSNDLRGACPTRESTHTTTLPATAGRVVTAAAAAARDFTRSAPAPPPAQAPLVCTSQPSPVSTKDASSGSSNDQNSWTTVNRKSKRPPARRNIVKGTGSFDSDLETVERVRKIHACFFKPETTPEAIVSYMKKKSPNDNYHVDKLKLAHNHYSSFSITVPSSQFEIFMAAESWPPITEVSEWLRRGDGRANSASSRRRPVAAAVSSR